MNENEFFGLSLVLIHAYSHIVINDFPFPYFLHLRPFPHILFSTNFLQTTSSPLRIPYLPLPQVMSVLPMIEGLAATSRIASRQGLGTGQGRRSAPGQGLGLPPGRPQFDPMAMPSSYSLPHSSGSKISVFYTNCLFYKICCTDTNKK